MMGWVVKTTDGTLAGKSSGEKEPPWTQEQAEQDAAERNRRAEALGIKTRYEAREA
jgi:hypothetical protein